MDSRSSGARATPRQQMDVGPAAHRSRRVHLRARPRLGRLVALPQPPPDRSRREVATSSRRRLTRQPTVGRTAGHPTDPRLITRPPHEHRHISLDPGSRRGRGRQGPPPRPGANYPWRPGRRRTRTSGWSPARRRPDHPQPRSPGHRRRTNPRRPPRRPTPTHPRRRSPAHPGAQPSTPVDLNKATLADLESLPGVGPVLAQRILDWRTEHGRFTTVDELQEVTGVGQKKFDSLKPHVRV